MHPEHYVEVAQARSLSSDIDPRVSSCLIYHLIQPHADLTILHERSIDQPVDLVVLFGFLQAQSSTDHRVTNRKQIGALSSGQL